MYSSLPPLARIAKKAGDVVLSMQEAVVANKNGEQERKPDGSIVTTADKEANRIICEELAEYFPGTAILSEENIEESNSLALQADERVDVDPIDNTTGYAKGRDGFSVNLGHIKDGVPIAGAVYWPARQELYFTGEDGKAYLQEGSNPPKEIQAKKLPLRDPLQVAVGYNQQHVEHLGDRNYEIQNHPAQMRTCMVARGECDLTGINTGRSDGYNSWDLAGPHAVLRAAGGEIVSTDGALVRYGKETIKLPPHIAGANDVLVSLGLIQRADIQADRSLV